MLKSSFPVLAIDKKIQAVVDELSPFLQEQEQFFSGRNLNGRIPNIQRDRLTEVIQKSAKKHLGPDSPLSNEDTIGLVKGRAVEGAVSTEHYWMKDKELAFQQEMTLIRTRKLLPAFKKDVGFITSSVDFFKVERLHSLANKSLTGVKGDYNPVKAVQYFWQALVCGDVRAAFDLYQIYDKGVKSYSKTIPGIEKNVTLAKIFLALAWEAIAHARSSDVRVIEEDIKPSLSKKK